VNDDLMQPRSDLACIDAVELVTDYLEAALPASERRRLELHLESCPGCSEYLEQSRTVAGSLGGLREQAIAQPVRASLIAVLRELRNR
jgi:anti-sigma factor RsiW